MSDNGKGIQGQVKYYEFRTQHVTLARLDAPLMRDEEEEHICKTRNNFKTKKFMPSLFSFVRNGKYYTCYYDNKEN